MQAAERTPPLHVEVFATSWIACFGRPIPLRKTRKLPEAESWKQSNPDRRRELGVGQCGVSCVLMQGPASLHVAVLLQPLHHSVDVCLLMQMLELCLVPLDLILLVLAQPAAVTAVACTAAPR